MKYKLEFDMPEDSIEFRNAINGYKWQSAMWNLDQKLRSMDKWKNIDKIEIDEVRDMIYEILSEKNLSFEEE